MSLYSITTFTLSLSLPSPSQMKNLNIIIHITTLLTLTTLATSSTSAYPPPYGGLQDPTTTPPPPTPVRREVYGGGRIFDITHKYRIDMPSYGSPNGIGEFIWLHESIKNGSMANVSVFKLLTHSGTHCDAPGHFYDEYFDQGFDIDTLDLEVLNGPALVVDVPRKSNITAEVLQTLNIPKGISRVIFKTLNTDRRLMWQREFDTSYVGFTTDGAKWLVENTDIKLVGTDYLSVAAYDHLSPGHLFLLKGRDIILVEALKLDGIDPGLYAVHCLPLRLPGAEGAPIRCILIK